MIDYIAQFIVRKRLLIAIFMVTVTGFFLYHAVQGTMPCRFP